MSSKNILVVEDETVIALDIESKLKNLGYKNIKLADSGIEAFNIIVKTPPDLILMDVILKGDNDGITVATQINETFDIPIIFLTAYSDNETIRRAKITEPYGYIIKPLRERELNVVIEIALYKHKIDNELKLKQNQLEELNKTLEQKVLERTDELSKEIEERKQLETILRQNEEIFRNMAEFLPVILVEADMNLKVSYLNKTGFDSLGYSPDDLKQILITDVLDPKDLQRLSVDIKDLFNGRQMEIRQYSIRKKDGTFLNALVISSLIYRNGQIWGFRTAAIDIKPFFLSSILPDKKFFEEYSFTQREQDILLLLARGLKYKAIAESLFISENTLKTHMSNIYDKMGVGNKDGILDAIKEFQVKYVGRDKLFMSILGMLIKD